MNKLRTAFFLSIIFLVVSCQSLQGVNISPVSEPTSDPLKGNVIGTINSKDKINIRGLLIYLGSIVTGPEGFIAGALDTKISPSTIVDEETGIFLLTNVEPGEYSLIIYEVEAGGKALVDSKGNIKVVVVRAGEETNIGLLNLDEIDP